jgi:hypothetical protein
VTARELIVTAARTLHAELAAGQPTWALMIAREVARERDTRRLRRQLAAAIRTVIAATVQASARERDRLASSIVRDVPAGELAATLVAVRMLARAVEQLP